MAKNTCVSLSQGYLALKDVVHGSLAAKNVYVGLDKTCKISNFGLTHHVDEKKAYIPRKRQKIPIKWMSIEAIIDQKSTKYSDVYEYSVILQFFFDW